MNAGLIHAPFLPASEVPWAKWWRNGQALALTVALHSAVVALLALGWTIEQQPVSAPSVLKTHLVTLPAAPVIAPPTPAPEPMPVAPPPVVEARPDVSKPVPDPQVHARQLEQAALARKRVEVQKQRQEAQRVEQQKVAEQRAQHLELQRQQAQADLLAKAAADKARRAEQAAAADIRQYLPISKEAPDYPQRALDKGIEGDCTVEYSVTPQGKVEAPKVVGNCHPAFIRPSLVAAATFRYKPRVVDGQPVSVSGVRNTFHYRIQ